jgi:hypothetical protein
MWAELWKEFQLRNCVIGSVVAALFVILRCWRATVWVDMWHGIGRRSRVCRVWWGRLKERDNLEGLRIDAEVILKWNLNRLHGRGLGLDSSGSE